MAVSAGDSPTSKTRALASAALELGEGGRLIDLLDLPADALLGRGHHPAVDEAVATAGAADVLVLSTPVYRATYSGALKAFLDRFPADGLAGTDGLARFYATAAPDSAQVTTEIDATAYFERKLAAMRAHATQITVDPPFFALSDGVRRPASGTEYYTLLAGPRGPGLREAGLFAR